MAVKVYSDAWGKLIHEKNRSLLYSMRWGLKWIRWIFLFKKNIFFNTASFAAIQIPLCQRLKDYCNICTGSQTLKSIGQISSILGQISSKSSARSHPNSPRSHQKARPDIPLLGQISSKSSARSHPHSAHPKSARSHPKTKLCGTAKSDLRN